MAQLQDGDGLPNQMGACKVKICTEYRKLSSKMQEFVYIKN